MSPMDELVGTSAGMAAVRDTIARLLQRQSERGRLPPLLIQGETGTGKGLLARVLHRAGPRAESAFVDVNCAAIPETLLEAELFGYERGAFTDARHAKAGLFQTANHGVLFLDEVGLLPEALQAKLLKALEDRAVRRLGGTRSEPIDIWILTATNADLATAVRERRFREDLYHRLAVVTVRLPALRERREDILLLAEHFLARACGEYDLRPKSLAPDAREALLAYPWPGNVRELVNVMERVALLSDATVVTGEILGLPSMDRPQGETPRESSATPLQDTLGSVERGEILGILQQTGWNITRTARHLGISRDTLRYRIEKHGLRRGGETTPARRRVARPSPAGPGAAPPPGAPGAPAPDVAGATVPRWERRRLAFLRSAVVVAPDQDPRLHASRAMEGLVEKVQSFGGRVEELGPAGLVGSFGLEPVEDAPRRAAHAAMAVQKAAERASAAGERVIVKSAICVQPVLVGAASGGAQIDVDGKREVWGSLEALVAGADADSITVSETAAPFLDRHFDLIPLTGAGGPRGYRLTARERPGLGLPRRLVPCVGRGHELDLLRSRLAVAMRGHGQVVSLVGEAGIGKSRLVLEFLQGVDRARVAMLEGRCQSYGGAIPYLPILDIVRRTLRIGDAEPPEAIPEKVHAGLRQLGVDAAEWAPPLLHLLGVKEGTERLRASTTTGVKARTFEALRQMGLRGARQRPLIFVIEDLQWIDPTSEECLAYLMESLIGAPALLVATYRPGYRPPWADRSYATQVALQPLAPEDSLSIVRSVLQRPDIADGLARVILEKTEGNPFFLEEVSRAVGEGDGQEVPASVPDTIQEVLLARIARLPEPLRALLQTASVLGREVSLPILRAVSGETGDLAGQLRELTRLEFLYPTPEPGYAFTHTLTQEVAYESLPPARREGLHLAAGRALEALYEGRLEDAYDRLAQHYARSGEADRAVLYLTRLAEKAARTHAHSEAVRTLDEALEHVDQLPIAERDRCRLDLLLRQAYSLLPLGAFRVIVERLQRHEAVLARLPEARLGGAYHFLIGRSHLFLGDDEQASHHARLGIAEALRDGDDATLGKIHYVLAQQGALSGRPAEGLEHGRKAVALCESAGEDWWVGPACWVVGLNHGLLGEFEAALEAEARACAFGEAVGDPQLLSSATWAIGVIRTERGEEDEGIAACRMALERSPDPLDTALASGWLGYAHLEKGEPELARPHLEQAVQLLEQFHFPQPRSWFLSFLAEAHRRVGSRDTARRLARHALDLATGARSAHGIGWAERVLGRLALDDAALDDADRHLAAAGQTFAAMTAPHEVARTDLDLAALARARGDRDAEARHLREARRRFVDLGLSRSVARVDALARTGTPTP